MRALFRSQNRVGWRCWQRLSLQSLYAGGTTFDGTPFDSCFIHVRTSPTTHGHAEHFFGSCTQLIPVVNDSGLSRSGPVQYHQIEPKTAKSDVDSHLTAGQSQLGRRLIWHSAQNLRLNNYRLPTRRVTFISNTSSVLFQLSSRISRFGVSRGCTSVLFRISSRISRFGVSRGCTGKNRG
jgi:hypothetical protein